MRYFHKTLICALASSLLVGCNEIFDLFLPETPSIPSGSSDWPSPDSSSAASSVGLNKIADQSGQTDEARDLRIISAEYDAQLPSHHPQSLAIAIPIEEDALPDDFHDGQLLPERYDASKGEWVSAGQFAWYDEDTQKVWFMASLPQASPSNMLTQQQTADTPRFRIRVYLFSNQLTATREGSHFRIHYYPSRLANPARVPTDEQWASSSGHATDASIPDYVEDLDYALNEAYERLLQLRSSQGQVFEALSVQDVYIADTGGNAGDSRLGGPMRISNRQITGWRDLQLTVAHEMAHVFQGQYYSLKGLFSGNYNRWFIEAVANYYAARVYQLSDNERRTFYGEFYNDYLSVSLTEANDSSMYAAGHFLDWLSAQYGDNLVGDALKASSGNDLIGLSKALKQANEQANISSAYEAYMQAILTQPEATDGFHQLIRNAMGQHAQGYGYSSGVMLNDRRTFVQLNKPLPIMTAVLANLSLANTDDALLVATTDGSTGALLKSLSYPFSSLRNADYSAVQPLDQYIAPTTKEAMFTIPHVGASQSNKEFAQLLFNSSPSSAAQAKAAYYLLKPPVISSQTDSSVSWSTASLGNIPADYIKGFKVYGREYNDAWKSPWRQLTGVIELQKGASNQSANFSPASENYRYELMLSVLDRFNNEWPKVNTGQKRIVIHQLTKDVNTSELLFGQTVQFEAFVEGLDDTRVTWRLESSGYYTNPNPGSLSTNGNKATYTAPSDYMESYLIATSVADPNLSERIYLWTNDGIVCVPGETPVTLVSGARKAIADIKAGDQIKAWDQQNQKLISATVEHLFVHRQEHPYDLHLIKGADGDDLRVTGNHPIYTREAGWIPVDQLKVGMTMMQFDTESQKFLPTKVLSIIREESKAELVYNLKTTAGDYFASDILVHNKCLSADSLIDTPSGSRPVNSLQVGDLVWGQIKGQRVATPISKLYRKETVLDSLPGKQYSPRLAMTQNHRLYWQGHWIKAAQSTLPDTDIKGAVYDLETEAGTYYASDVLMGKN